MIKFTASGDNVVIVGLGLEPENIRRMAAGQPIRVRLSDLGFTGAVGAIQLVIFSGTDREALEQTVRPFIGPDTVIHSVKDK